MRTIEIFLVLENMNLVMTKVVDFRKLSLAEQMSVHVNLATSWFVNCFRSTISNALLACILYLVHQAAF